MLGCRWVLGAKQGVVTIIHTRAKMCSMLCKVLHACCPEMLPIWSHTQVSGHIQGPLCDVLALTLRNTRRSKKGAA